MVVNLHDKDVHIYASFINRSVESVTITTGIFVYSISRSFGHISGTLCAIDIDSDSWKSNAVLNFLDHLNVKFEV